MRLGCRILGDRQNIAPVNYTGITGFLDKQLFFAKTGVSAIGEADTETGAPGG